MFCPKCGNEVPEGSGFCGKCGNPINPQYAGSTQPIQESQVSDGDTAESSSKEAAPAKKKKKSKIIVPIAAVLLVAVIGVAAAFATDGFGLLGDSETESSDDVEVSYETEASEEPEESEESDTSTESPSESKEETVYYAASVNGSLGISSVDGDFSPISIENVDFDKDGTIEGPFREGYALVSWLTYDYDEEWEENYNYVPHLACVDETGNLALDLDDAIPESIIEHYASEASRANLSSDDILSSYVVGSPYFNDGYMLIRFSFGADTAVCVDIEGNVLWTVECSIADDAFKDDVVVIDNDFYSTDGELLFATSEYVREDSSSYTSSYGQSAGDGFIAIADDAIDDYLLSIIDYSGNKLIESNSQFDVYDYCNVSDAQYGYAILSVSVDSPHGTTASKGYRGLWSLEEETWVIGPITTEEIESLEFCGPELLYFSDGDNEGYIDYQGDMIVTLEELTDATGVDIESINYWYDDWYYFEDRSYIYFFQIDETGLIRYTENYSNNVVAL